MCDVLDVVRVESLQPLRSKGSMSSMGSIGWEFSSADVGVFTNHQSKEAQCVQKVFVTVESHHLIQK